MLNKEKLKALWIKFEPGPSFDSMINYLWVINTLHTISAQTFEISIKVFNTVNIILDFSQRKPFLVYSCFAQRVHPLRCVGFIC